MTVVLGIRAEGAVILAADGRTTSGRGAEFRIDTENATKMVAVVPGAPIVALFSNRSAIAKQPVAALAASSEFTQFQRHMIEPSKADVLMVGRRLRNYFNSIIESSHYSGPDLDFVVAGYSPGELRPEAFSFTLGDQEEESMHQGFDQAGWFLAGTPQTRPTDPNYKGESAAERIFAAEMKKRSLDSMTVEDAVELAQKVVGVATATSRRVGGRGSLWVLRQHGDLVRQEFDT